MTKGLAYEMQAPSDPHLLCEIIAKSRVPVRARSSESRFQKNDRNHSWIQKLRGMK
jgi:hypothetical protein